MPSLIENAKSLCSEQTEAEKRLWYYLRDHRLNGLKFRRQMIMGKYIVDFINHDKKIIVELDGGQHAEQENYDFKRTRWLESKGYRVLRFWNNEVLGNSETVLELIMQACGVEVEG